MRRILLLCPLLIMPVLRFVPGISIFWTDCIAAPVSRILQSISARFPFPLLEIAAILAAASLIDALLHRKFRRIAGILTAMLAGYVLLWYPFYWTSEPPQFVPSAAELEVVSLSLINDLNQTGIPSPTVSGALQTAVNAVSAYTGRPLSGSPVKAVRYPEWMRRLGISGLYSPWTGEALVDSGAFPGALVFTACHELMHREGIADEGLANIEAWKACILSGGSAAASAKLWALRYAMPMLREADETAWRRCLAQMNADTLTAFRAMNGFAPRPEPGRWLKSAQNYEALAGWLAIDIAAND